MRLMCSPSKWLNGLTDKKDVFYVGDSGIFMDSLMGRDMLLGIRSGILEVSEDGWYIRFGGAHIGLPLRGRRKPKEDDNEG